MAKTSPLARIADVDIDSDGVFKYILIKVKAKDGVSKTIVRGYSWAQYHGTLYVYDMYSNDYIDVDSYCDGNQ